MTVFQKILYELATKNVVPKLALVNTIDATNYTIYQQIKRAREQKLIREVSYKNTYGRKQSTIDCLVLTPAGVKYIRDNLSNEIPWAEYISTSFDSVSILGDFPNKKRMVGRFSKITAAAVMADNIGANESRIYYADFAQSELEQSGEGKQSEKPAPKNEEIQSDEDAFMDYDDDIVYDEESDEAIDEMLDELISEMESDFGEKSPKAGNLAIKDEDTDIPTPSLAKPTLSSLICEATSTYMTVRNKLLDATDAHQSDRDFTSEITFYDALSIKRTVEERNSHAKVKADVRGGRYAGILDSPVRSCFVYTLTPASPMIWYERFLARELTAMRIVKRLQTGYKHIDEQPNGILLVTDPRTFEETYNAHEHIGAKKFVKGITPSRIPECGDKLSNLWVVPFSEAGNAELLAIMTTDIERERQEIIAKLLETGDYEENTKVSREQFPIKDSFGTLIAIGTHMDVRKMKNIEKVINTFHSDKPIEYAIICFQWQVPYYEAVMHGVEIIPVDEELPEYLLEWKSMKPKMPIEKEAELWRSLLDDKLVGQKNEAKRRRDLTRIVNALMKNGDTPEDVLTASQQYRSQKNTKLIKGIPQ